MAAFAGGAPGETESGTTDRAAGVSPMPTAAQLERKPTAETPVSPEELDAFIERLRRKLEAKHAELLALLAELAKDEPHR